MSVPPPFSCALSSRLVMQLLNLTEKKREDAAKGSPVLYVGGEGSHQKGRNCIVRYLLMFHFQTQAGILSGVGVWRGVGQDLSELGYAMPFGDFTVTVAETIVLLSS